MGTRAGCCAVAVLALAAVFLSGCGGGGSAPASQTAVLTGGQIVSRANAMCKNSQVLREKRYNVANEWLAEEGGHMTRPLRKKIIRYMVISPVESLSEELKSLGSSDGNGKAVEGYAHVLDKEVAKASLKPLTVASGTAFAAADESARKLGLTKCAL